MTASKKQQRWYLGGMGACMAVLFTHPLDTIKVHLQTQQGKDPVHRVLVKTLKTNGIMGIYSGLSASVLRQATYTSVRFGAYEVARARLTPPTVMLAAGEEL
ncbi:mitochondrial dicarboxylate carrier-like [Bolinopsis microptera]|uniref:mitochondrial dicarboxylate carrier-like n=1 Tax=Bolinopsis microptera TaxID=2820187 RepID=UPI003079604C